MIYLVAFVVLVLATARLTRLIHFDDITTKWRLGLKQGSLLEKIAFCPWCASVWAAIITCSISLGIFNRLHADDMPIDAQIAVLLLLILATSYPAGWLVHKETVATSRGE